MARALIQLRTDADRKRAARWVQDVPAGTRVEFKEAKRSTEQNARMWAMLTDVASQLKWHGQRYTPDDWKLLFLDAYKREVRMAPTLDGHGLVNMGRSSSDLSKHEMSEMIELIASFGVNHGVRFNDPEI